MESETNQTSEETVEVQTSLEDQISDILDESIDESSIVSEPVVEDIKNEENSSEESENVEGDVTHVETESTTTESNSEGQTLPPADSDDKVTVLENRIAALTEQLNKLATSSTPALEKEVDLGIAELMESMDFDQIMESKESFVKFLSEAFRAVSKSTLGQVNEVVPQVITRQTAMEDMRRDFYDAYPELNVVRPYVAQVASTIASAHPDWGVTQVLAEAAKVSKASLGIPSVATTTTAAPKVASPKTPSLPGGSSSARKPQVKGSMLQNEIDDFLKDD